MTCVSGKEAASDPDYSQGDDCCKQDDAAAAKMRVDVPTCLRADCMLQTDAVDAATVRQPAAGGGGGGGQCALGAAVAFHTAHNMRDSIGPAACYAHASLLPKGCQQLSLFGGEARFDEDNGLPSGRCSAQFWVAHGHVAL